MIDVTRAVCPSCGGFEHYTVHIRSDLHKDLVCQSCRKAGPQLPAVPPAFSPKAAGIGDGPAAKRVAPNPVLRPGRRRTPRKIY